jgi:excisionase family DNA binding protein
MENEPTPMLALSPVETARALGIHRSRIFAAIRAGELRAHAIGNKSKIWRDDIEQWFKAQPLTKRRKADG